MQRPTSETPRRTGVTYNRVSTKKQDDEGDGLNSQEARSLEYARYNNIDIVDRFQDTMSGKHAKRPGMQALLKWLRANRKLRPIVIIEDVTRLARNIRAHHDLRDAIEKAGGELRCPNIEFGTSSASRLNENIQATFSEYHRLQNAEQTRNRRRARMLNGYWVHFAPLGYEYADAPVGGGRVLVRKEPLATIIADGMNGLADGRFSTKGELKHYWEQFPEFPRDAKGQITHEQVDRILSRVIYAGYIQSDIMQVSFRPAQSPALVSLDTFNRMHERLKKGAYAATRKDVQDFVLRGFVSCADCGNPLTGCHSKGKMGVEYAYYYCFTKGCSARSKTIRKELLESEFETIAQSLVPSPEVYTVAHAILQDAWDRQAALQQQRRKGLQTQLAEIEQESAKLLAKVVEVESRTVMNALEKRIDALEMEKYSLGEKIAQCGRPLKSFDATLQTSMLFLKNPLKLWSCGQYEERRLLLKFAFTDRLPYRRGEGFQTPQKSLLFSALGRENAQNLELAERAGIVRFDSDNALTA